MSVKEGTEQTSSKASSKTADVACDERRGNDERGGLTCLGARADFECGRDARNDKGVALGVDGAALRIEVQLERDALAALGELYHEEGATVREAVRASERCPGSGTKAGDAM